MLRLEGELEVTGVEVEVCRQTMEQNVTK